MFVKSILIYCFLSIFSSLIIAQQEEMCLIHGTVTDSINSETLIGVTILLKNSRQGTVTDASGKFSLSVPRGDQVLVFSYVGYATQEIKISSCKPAKLSVALQKEEVEIEGVQITAQRKFFGNMEYGRAIPSIGVEEIENQSISNASDILHARIAGVWATKTSGAPGDQQKIRIRGQNSFFSSAEPLYVVDGVPVPIVNMASLGIADLNIHDIENVTVLRDASSASLYGFQGGNGVVLIDTKRGSGELKFNLLTRFGYHWQSNFYDLMNTKDFLTSVDSAYYINHHPLRFSYPEYSDTLCYTDWQREFLQPAGSQEYQFSASGSKKNTSYYFSGNHLDQNGTLIASSYTRQTITARIGQRIGKKLAFDIGYRGSWQKNRNNQNEYRGNRLLFYGINKSPCLSCTPDSFFFDDDERLRLRTYCPYYPALSHPYHPDSLLQHNSHQLTINNHIANISARFQINDHWHMDLMESFMSRHSLYTSSFTYEVYNVTNYLYQDSTTLESREDVLLFNHQINLSYNRIFGKHTLGALIAHRFYEDNLWWNVDSLKGTIPEHYSLKNSMAAYGPKGSVLRFMSSYITHINYNFRNTYFISAIANCSHVKQGLYVDYYTLFPSLAFSWNLANEPWMHKLNWLDDFSFYINWGQSGNTPLNGLANELFEYVPSSLEGIARYDPAILQLANHHLKHERTEETDFGLQSGYLKGRLNLNAVYYIKHLDNMILLRDIPQYYGGGKQYLNFGSIQVRGYELGVDLVPLHTHNFYWKLRFNYSKSAQKVGRLVDNQDMLFYDNDILFPTFIVKEGEVLGDIYGYKFLGKMLPEDWDSESNSFVSVQRGKYLNADSSDSRITESDKVILGNSIPDFTFNFLSSLQYKNFGIDFTWYAVIGVSKYNATRAASVMKGVNREVNGYISDTLMTISTKNFYESDVFVEDASFIRLKNLTFSYTSEKLIQDKIALKLSISIENLITITRYKGYDPEATIFTDNNFSDNALDRGAYPSPRAVYFTLNISF